jgi:O-antigen/teichoic acid export membrane protein
VVDRLQAHHTRVDTAAVSPSLELPPPSATTLRRALVQGVAYGALARWSAQALSWTATLLVARLLSPGDYGIVAMATVLHGLVTVISEFGVGTTVVTLRHLSSSQVAQLNSLSVLLGAAGCAVMAGLAPAIAAFFARPDVAPVVAALGGTFVLSGLRTVPSALLHRDLRFLAISTVEGVQAIVAAGTTLYGAWNAWGYWAIVAGTLAGSAAWTVLLLALRPAAFARPRRAALGAPLSFTRHQLTGSVAWYCYSNADFVVAGRWLGAHELGIYSMAWTLARVVPERLANVVVRTTPAFFAAVSHEPARLRQWVSGITEGLALACFPLLAVVSVNADAVIRLIGGTQWDAAVMPLRLLSIYAAFDIVAQPVSRALVAAGDVRFTSRLGVALAIVMPAGFVAGVQAGATGLAFSWLLIAPAVRVMALLRLQSAIGLTIRDYARTLSYPAIATAIMSLAMWLVRQQVAGAGPFEQIALAAAAGAAIYGTVLLVLMRREGITRLGDYFARVS